MPRAFRKSLLINPSEKALIDNSHWNYFLFLEKEFEKSLQYVHLTEDNYSSHSLVYLNQLISIGTEFETVLKILCNVINGSKPGNMGKYKEIVLGRFNHIWNTPVYIDYQGSLEIFPLKVWENKGERLEWWDDYTKLKHERHSNFKKANLKNVLNALASLLILEVYLYRLAYPDPAKYRYGTSLLRTPSLAEMMFLPVGELPDEF